MNSAAALAQAEQQLEERDLIRALDTFETAEALGAEPNRCAGGRWLAHMLLGNFESAWRESDAISTRTPDDANRFWRGEDLTGKAVILRCLHGFGDAVQFLRFIPELHRKARCITLEVAPHFMVLARKFEGADDVITWGEGAPGAAPEWDVQIEVNELPYLLRLTSSQLPWREKYLRVTEEELHQYRVEASQDSSVKVGLVWSSGEWNPQRSLIFDDLAPIFAVSGCEFWNLQGGTTRRDWPGEPRPHLHSAEACANNLVALAAIIAQLDLVIASDTLVVHLAGAMGVPCWAMLHQAADWRWMHDRSDSPWYPTVSLFRRERGTNWLTLTKQVARELSSLADLSLRL